MPGLGRSLTCGRDGLLIRFVADLVEHCHSGSVTGKRLTLVRAVATQVLGEYTHEITFPAEDDFMIVYGPNGVGKTKFLEIIRALSQIDGGTLQALPFDTAALYYSDGTILQVRGIDLPMVAVNGKWISRRLQFVIEKADEEPATWDFEEDEFESYLDAHTTWRRYDEAGLWEDAQDGELVHISELKDRFADVDRRQSRSESGRPLPELFRRLRAATPTYLIETQRLRTASVQTNRFATPRHPARRRVDSKIVQYGARMQGLLASAQTAHSTITQQLDRDFPLRVLSGVSVVPHVDDVRRRYEEQNDFRSRLGRVASVDLSDELELPDRPLEEWELRLLNLYLDDAQKKLAPFAALLRKVELLEEVVNSRLLRKRLAITAKDGLSVQHQSDDRPISLDSLSSGEQHEIILMFDLLFNVPAGALVMIDEPEISLHVVWQLAFIPDVQRIAELADFRFIVATHSPQIINDDWDRATALGPEEVPFA